MKTVLSLTTAVYFILFITGLGTVQSAIAAAGIVLNALVVAVHSREFKS